MYLSEWNLFRGVEAKQLAAHQTLPAVQFLAQLLGEELLAQNYCLVVHYRAPHFV